MKFKRAISLFMTIIMTFSMLVPFSISSFATGGVQAKLNEVMEKFPPSTSASDKNMVYFTVDGKPSTSYSSPNCYYPDVAKANGYNWDDMWPSWSCCGFVHFTFRYIFGSEFTWEDSVKKSTHTVDKSKSENDRLKALDKFFKNCKVGDAICMNRSSKDDKHYAIFLSYDAESQIVKTYDCGWEQECAVKTLNRSLNKMKDYHSIDLFRANNYDEIDKKYGTEPTWDYKIISKTDKTIEIKGYSEDVKDLKIPEKVDGYKVIRIADNAFANTSVTKLTLPKTLTSIGVDAFAGTPFFINAKLDNGALYVGNYLLYAGDVEDGYEVKSNATLIADGAFQYAFISSVRILSNVKYIGKNAFSTSRLKYIYGFEDTPAQAYAEKNGIEFVSLGSKALFIEQINNTIANIGEIDKHLYTISSATRLTDAINNANKLVNDKNSICEQLIDALEELENAYDSLSVREGIDYTIGDVNGDGKLSVADAKKVLQCVAKTITLDDTAMLAADVNDDCKISIVDAKWILQAVAGIRSLTPETDSTETDATRTDANV